MTRAVALAAFALAASLLSFAAAAQTRHTRNAETGVERWAVEHRGVAVEMTQITPEQAQAFFLGRGFPTAAARHYSRACVFMVIVRNVSVEAPVAYDLGGWHARREDGSRQALMTREDWMKEWEARALPQAARIGFEWSQLPTRQSFERGDWNQGMASVGLPAGARFDLLFEWSAGGRTHQGKLEGVRCASDAS